MNLLLVRHGEILSNVQKVYAGTSSEGLTEKGIIQAREVSDKLKKYKVDMLYSSPIQRAVQTAETISETLGIGYVIKDAFRELEMGPWEGKSESDIANDYSEQWKIWNSRPAELRLIGRETLEDLLGRVLSGIRDVYQSNSDKTIVVVSHVAIIRVLLLWCKKNSLNFYKTIHVPNAEVFEIEIDSYP